MYCQRKKNRGRCSCLLPKYCCRCPMNLNPFQPHHAFSHALTSQIIFTPFQFVCGSGNNLNIFTVVVLLLNYVPSSSLSNLFPLSMSLMDHNNGTLPIPLQGLLQATADVRNPSTRQATQTSGHWLCRREQCLFTWHPG